MTRNLRGLALLASILLACAVPAPALASGLFLDFNLGFSVNVGPPALPVYEQPPCPAPNYLWTPGYWAWKNAGYYWVPGTWVAPPRVGLLWTPGYWAFNAGTYAWRPGYWASHVGYYGGINYGHGYFGAGYGGGVWRGGIFAYNTAVTRVDTTIVRNVYVNRTVINNYYTTTNVSYNGGPHGVYAQPTPEERRIETERHFNPTVDQRMHEQVASRDRTMFASVNRGRPAEAAVPQPYSPRNLPVHQTAWNRPDEGRGPQPNAAAPERRYDTQQAPNATYAHQRINTAYAQPRPNAAYVRHEQRPQQTAHIQRYEAKPARVPVAPQREDVLR